MLEELNSEKMLDALTAVLDTLPVGTHEDGRLRGLCQEVFDYSIVNCKGLGDKQWMSLFGLVPEELLATISMRSASANNQSGNTIELAIKRDGTILVHDRAGYLGRFGFTKEEAVNAVIAAH